MKRRKEIRPDGTGQPQHKKRCDKAREDKRRQPPDKDKTRQSQHKDKTRQDKITKHKTRQHKNKKIHRKLAKSFPGKKLRLGKD